LNRSYLNEKQEYPLPTYEYLCTECGDRKEVVQSFTEPSLTTCEVCGGRLRKVIFPVGIQFKGSGFYSTDRRASQPMSRAAKQDKDAKAESTKDSKDSKSESSTDTKSETKSESKTDSKKSDSGSSGSKDGAPKKAIEKSA
jgi:putative FmdB family regulatory protein